MRPGPSFVQPGTFIYSNSKKSKPQRRRPSKKKSTKTQKRSTPKKVEAIMRRQKLSAVKRSAANGSSLPLLDNSTLPIEQTEIARTFQIKVEPLNSLPPLNSPAPLTFDIPESTVFYTAASELYLDVAWRCLHADGSVLAPNEQMSVINAPFCTMFRDVEVYCNNRQISFNTGHYPIVSYIHTLLFIDESTKRGSLSNVLWKQDAAGTLDLFTPAGANDASDWRGEMISQSRVVHMHGKLMCDVLSSQRLIPPNTLLKLKLFPVPASFVFMGAAGQNYALELVNASLFVTRVELTAPAMSQKEQELQRTGYLYPIIEHRIVEKNIAPNSQKMIATLFSNEPLPSRLFLVFSRTQSLLGDNTMNPLRLITNNLNNLAVSVNGVQLPHIPFTPNFRDGNYSRELMQLYKYLKEDYKGVLTKEDFSGGCGIFLINLQPLNIDANYRSRPFSGHVQVNAQWSQPIADGLTLLAIGSFNATILLDSQRQVFIRRD